MTTEARTHYLDKIGARVLCLAVLPLIACMSLGLLFGCGQQTQAPVAQDTGQDLGAVTTTEQDAATQGSQVNTWVINAPARGGMPSGGLVNLSSDDGISNLVDEILMADGTTVQGTDAGYAQSGITINITTGGDTPSLAGTTTATPTSTQTSSAYPTVSPRQEVKPETSASVPIAVGMPGSQVDQQSVATGRGQTADTSKESANELRWAKLEAMADRLGPLLPLLEAALGEAPVIPAATTQPAGP